MHKADRKKPNISLTPEFYLALCMPVTGAPMPSGTASTSTKATRARLPLRFAQAWLVPRWIAGLQLDRRLIHVHLDLALDDDHVVDGLGAVHVRLIAGRKVDHREACAVRRRRGTDDAAAHVLGLLADRYRRRRALGAPH